MGLLSDLTGGVINDNGPFIPGVDNPFQSSQTVWLPGAGGLNPLNSQSAVGQLTKDVGALNPFNPDSVAGKVVSNVAADMGKDPAKWIAIAAAVAAGQPQLIPYINATAAVTSKNSSPEEWLKEGAKAYLISSGGEWVAKNVGGVGPQTDVTTGEAFAGTGAAGATGSAQVGVAAGNIARNIFATAARKGSTDINSAQIVTGALTSEALNEAFKQMPGFENLSKAEQSATVNAFKTAFNKDSNAAYQLFNQGFDATIKGLNTAAKAAGYKDLNQQNAVNNFVLDQGSTEDIDALKQYEQKAQDAYNAYAPMKEKNDAWFAKNDQYAKDYATYNSLPVNLYTFGQRVQLAKSLNDQYGWLQDPQNYYTPDKVTAAEQAYNAAKADAEPFIKSVSTLQEQGWDNLAQQKAAAAAGFTTPEAYDTYLTDEAEKLRKAGLEEKTDVDLNKVVSGADTAAIGSSSGSVSGGEGLGTEGPSDVVNTLTKSGLEDTSNVVDLNKVVSGADTVAAGTGTDTVAGTKGTDTTTGDGTAMGDTTKALAGADAYKYDPATKTYTYTSDDGSTLTLNESGDVVGSTEATDTSWADLTDTATGNLKLPKLPSGFMPTVKAPAKKATTTTNTTTGAGNTAVTTGSSTVVSTGSWTTVQTSGGLNIPALLAIMGGLGGDQQAQQPQIETYDPGKGFEYFDWESDPFAPKTKEKTNPTAQPKMAEGGSIDELLEILRRSGI